MTSQTSPHVSISRAWYHAREHKIHFMLFDSERHEDRRICIGADTALAEFLIASFGIDLPTPAVEV